MSDFDLDYNIYIQCMPQKYWDEYKLDIAILLRNSNINWCRLIHDKNTWNERFYLTEVPNSKDVAKKARKIKQMGLWDDVREDYKKLKNMYLIREDKNHPSYVCYVEAVNAVWYRNNLK